MLKRGWGRWSDAAAASVWAWFLADLENGWTFICVLVLVLCSASSSLLSDGCHSGKLTLITETKQVDCSINHSNHGRKSSTPSHLYIYTFIHLFTNTLIHLYLYKYNTISVSFPKILENNNFHLILHFAFCSTVKCQSLSTHWSSLLFRVEAGDRDSISDPKVPKPKPESLGCCVR